MTLRFVKTSVLSSSDGIDFSNEVAVESEEARLARLAAERAAQRPLYEQLAEQRQKKQDEYDANTKLIFAPPKALDADEVSFLRNMEDSQEQLERKRKEEEEAALDLFRARKDSAAPPPPVAVRALKAESKPPQVATAPPVTIIRVKRKAEPLQKEEPKKAAPAALFADYGSDEDNSDNRSTNSHSSSRSSRSTTKGAEGDATQF